MKRHRNGWVGLSATVFFLLAQYADRAWGKEILIVEAEPGEVASTCDRLALPFRVADRVTNAALADADGVVVRADKYPEPQQWSEEEWRVLQDFVRRGGRAYLEFTAFHGAFDLVTQPHPERFLHERLVAQEGHEVTQYLPPEALLDEHGAAGLRFVQIPSEAQTLLHYEKALGTYTRIDPPDPSLFSVTVDLGELIIIHTARQHYGAEQPNYYPEKVTLSLSEDGKQYREVATRSSSVPPLEKGGAGGGWAR